MKNLLLLMMVIISSISLIAQSTPPVLSINKTTGASVKIPLSEIQNITFETTFLCGTSTVDYFGKTYHSVQIGTQCWLKENLDVGTMLTRNSAADSMRNNGIIEKYCYDNLQSNCTNYGGLYLWNEAMQYVTNEGAQGICPTGWHIPTQADFGILMNEVNNDGNALKAQGQGTGTGQGTNTSGFSSLLGGIWNITLFTNISNVTYYHSSKMVDATFSYGISLVSTGNSIYTGSNHRTNGFPIRCIKN